MGLRSLVPAGARALLSPTGIAGVAVEGVWVTLHLALYPWGLLEDRLDEASHLGVSHLSPVQRGLIVGDVEAAGTPIILVHGVIDNRSIFTLLRRSLRGRGFGRLYALNYSPFTDDIADVAARLGTLIEEVCEQTGYERVHIIGHSMGGLIARYYVQRLGGDAHVHTVCTLGTPHCGTVPARFVPWPVIRQMRPTSDIIDRARRAGAGLPHPLHRHLVRPRPARPAAAQRAHPAPRPAGPQRAHPRHRAHVAARRPPRRARDLDGARPARPRRLPAGVRA